MQCEAASGAVAGVHGCFFRDLALQAYRFRCRAMRVPPDDALSALLAFLVLYLEPVQKAIKVRRKAMRGWALIGVGAVAIATLLTGLRRQAQRRRTA